jgi:nitrite reductase/ring-hydroxylating ferredoxin subunit
VYVDARSTSCLQGEDRRESRASEIAIKIPARDDGTGVAGWEHVQAMAGDMPVMLVKRGGRIFALAETCCSHLGGPLSEGEFDGERLKCPWHGSRFAVEYGSVIDGPTSFAQPCFETRVRAVRIEVRARR